MQYIKYIIRFLYSIILKFRNIKASPRASFNLSTKLEGFNVVHQNSYIGGSNIGRCTYIGQNCTLINCKIGRFCSIAENVKVISSTHPTHTYISTSPCFFSVNKQCGISFTEKNCFKENLSIEGYNIIIENDVWIGSNVTIMGGIKIGNGAIIAMGAVVTKDVPPYAIVGGVPAKIIRYRFTQEEIEKLLKIKWWDKQLIELKEKAIYFTNINNIDKL